PLADRHLPRLPTRRSSDLAYVDGVWLMAKRCLTFSASAAMYPSSGVSSSVPHLASLSSANSTRLAEMFTGRALRRPAASVTGEPDRKSTRLNSSHVSLSYA